MKCETISDGGTRLAMVVRNADWQPGLNFISADTDYIQAGIWGYAKGHKLAAHRHLAVPRQIDRTQEVLFVKQGRLRADIYDEADALVKSVELEAGDVIVLLAGGHGYEMLADGTMVLEVKNGPYVGADKDRKRI